MEVVCLALVLGSVGATTALEPGSGRDYLQHTEEGWDGKTPWFTGSSCECNGWATRCQFSEELFRETGAGGRCLQCRGARDGPQCQQCLPGHHPAPGEGPAITRPCLPCHCDPLGSTDTQCGEEGTCTCRPGVGGPRCQACLPNHWGFPRPGDAGGCQPCGCQEAGSLDNSPQCSVEDGSCVCKQNVEGRQCSECRQGHFSVSRGNPWGCSPCFCYGHTDQCKAASRMVVSSSTSDFSRGPEDWVAEEAGRPTTSSYNAYQRLVSLRGGASPAYFLAPPTFLGERLPSYGRQLSFRLRLGGEVTGASPGPEDLVLEGGGPRALRVAIPITGQGNPLPTDKLQQYRFTIHESAGWAPRLGALELLSLMSNLTAIRIRGSYATGGRGYLDQVELETAVPGYQGSPADWVEECACPPGYEGAHCQYCQAGFHREPGTSGPFGRCLPCSCHGHTDTCHQETGECRCGHNTSGPHCGECAPGYYGDATSGSPDACQACPCPRVGDRPGACYAVPGEGGGQDTVCTECPAGRLGARCELCAEGTWGAPAATPPRPCRPCSCNGNSNLDEPGSCDRRTGECLRCAGHTTGWHCESCMEGYYGDATDGSGCSPCRCHGPGSEGRTCGQEDGRCSCRDNVLGHLCDRCAPGYWNIHSAAGCDPCNCDPIGSLSRECGLRTGACRCRPGVAGQRCDTCAPHHWGFGLEGCQTCDCDMTGALNLQCDELTGQCSCRDQVEGRRCQRCQENTQASKGQVGERLCEPCDICYTLVKKEVDLHRAQLTHLGNLLQTIAENPEPVGDNFETELKRVEMSVSVLLEETRKTVGGGESMRSRLEDLASNLASVTALAKEADGLLDEAEVGGGAGWRRQRAAAAGIRRAQVALGRAKQQLEVDATEALRVAQERARRFGEGSERMTGIAGRARQLSDQQARDAEEMKKRAELALEMASNANQLSRDALEEQVKKAEKITVLRNQLRDLEGKLDTVQSLSLATLDDATMAYDQALGIYQQAFNLDPSTGSTRRVEEGAAEVAAEARRVRGNAERLLAENSGLLDKVVSDREELEELMARALSQQQQVEARLADLSSHQGEAAAAVHRGNQVLLQARATLEALRNFESRVKDNKDAANQALVLSGQIGDTIEEALEKTGRASGLLQDSDKDSQLALSLAREAAAMAGKASGLAQDTSAASAGTREGTGRLLAEARSCRGELAATASQVGEKEAVAARDAALAADTLRVASTAQGTAEHAAAQVIQAREELEAILRMIATVEEPEPGLMDQLERRLEAAEKLYTEAGLEARVAGLQEAKQRQTDQLFEYRAAMEELEVEYGSIEEIRNSLPDQCWNKIRLEP